eukprot:3443559-Amphidinium_carterae.1
METLDRHQKQVADLAAQQQKAFDTLRKKRDADDLPRAYQPRFGAPALHLSLRAHFGESSSSAMISLYQRHVLPVEFAKVLTRQPLL